MNSTSGADLASKASVVVFSKAIAAVSRIAAIALLARLLSKEEFGLLSFALLTYLSVSTLSQLGLPNSIFYYLGIVPAASHRTLVLLFSRILFYIGIGASILLILIGWIASLRGYHVLGLLVPMAFLGLLELPTLHIQNVLIGVGRAKMAAMVTILFSVALFAAMVVPAVFGLPIEAIAYALVGYGVIRVLVSVRCFADCLWTADGDLPSGMMRQVIAYSVPLGVADILWKVNQFIDKYVVMFLLPVVAFAEYSVGAWEIPLVPMIAASVSAVMMPQLVELYLRRDKTSLLDLLSRSITKVSLIVLPLMVLLVIISRDLMVALFSRQYAGAGIVFAVYTLTLFQRVTDYSAVLRAINRTGAVTRWAAATALLNLVLSVPFVLWMGMVGAAVATLVATIVSWVYILVVTSWVLNIPFARVFPFRFYGRTLLVAVAAAFPVVVLGRWLELSPGLAIGVKSLLYLGTYVLLSTLSGLWGRSDWLFVADLLGLRRRSS